MAAINAEIYRVFAGNTNRRDGRLNRTASSGTRGSDATDMSSTGIFGFLMALICTALLLLTEQPFWVLLPVVVGGVMAMLVGQVSRLALRE